MSKTSGIQAQSRSKRVAFVHTVPMLIDVFRQQMKHELPDVDCFHILNESLLKDLLRDGPSVAVNARIVQQAALAAEAGVDIVVFTCSSTSPAIDLARQLIAVPILKIDDPMAQQAVACGSRIGILCTTTSTVEPSRNLILSHAERLGRPVSADVVLVPRAYDALQAGNREEHDNLVSAAAVTLSQSSDVLVLAQASLAHLQSSIGAMTSIPVLASPPLLMEELSRRLTA